MTNRHPSTTGSASPDRSRARILLITRNLPPLIGGMEKLNWHMADELSRQAQVHIIGATSARALKPDATEFTSANLNPLWRFLLQTAWHSIRIAWRWKPDTILAGSGLTAPFALMAARLCGAKAFVYLHGLDITINSATYQMLWIPAIKCMDGVITNSRATAQLAQEIGVAPTKLHVVHPGVGISTLPEDKQSVAVFREKYHWGQRPILLSVGRLAARKGILEFVEHCLPQIVANIPNVLLVIVGDTPNDSLSAHAQSKEAIFTKATKLGVSEHIQFLGKIAEDQLQLAYQAAAAHVFPVKHIARDPEGFGMVALEAAARGLPTVAFATGGVVDAVSDGTSGVLVKSGDYRRMVQEIVSLVTHDTIRPESCRAFAQQFSWDEYGKKILAILRT